MFITLTPSGFEVLHKHTFTMQNPLYWWTQQDRSRTPSTRIWSSRVYKRTQDVKSTYQMGPSYLCFLVDPIVRKPSTKPKKNPDLPGRDFFTLPLEPCCARPRFKSLTLARCAHSASRTQRTEKPPRRLLLP